MNTIYAINLKNLEIAKFTYQDSSENFNTIDLPMLPLEKKKPNPIIIGLVCCAFFFFIFLATLVVSSRLRKD